jgi:hypothetical protein
MLTDRLLVCLQADEVAEALEAGRNDQRGKDFFAVAEELLAKHSVSQQPRAPPADEQPQPQQLPAADIEVGKWCFQVLNRSARTSTQLQLEDTWSPKFLKVRRTHLSTTTRTASPF